MPGLSCGSSCSFQLDTEAFSALTCGRISPWSIFEVWTTASAGKAGDRDMPFCAESTAEMISRKQRHLVSYVRLCHQDA